MRMQVILDSSFARPGSAPIWGGKKGEFRDWTSGKIADLDLNLSIFSNLRFLRDVFTWLFFSSLLLWELVHDKI